MESALVIAIVLVAITAAGAWWLHRRHREVVGDGDGADWPTSAGPTVDDAPAPLLDRDALLRGRRPFNPSGWDDTPDDEPASEAPATDPGQPQDGELPTYFDRDFLAKRQRKDDPEA